MPDVLSRMHAEEVSVQSGCTFVELSNVGFDSEEYLQLIATVKKDQSKLPDLKVEGNHLFKRTFSNDSERNPIWRLWIPSCLTQTVIINAHDPPSAGHGGFLKTLERVKRNYFWPKMVAEIKEYVSKCKEVKAPSYTLRPPMGDQRVVERSFQHLYIDLLGPYPRSKRGNTTLLIALDQFSKFVFLKPLRQANSVNIVEYLESEVFSDNGVQFVSKIFADLMSKYGVRHICTASHAPQANASERVNRSILSAIRSYLKEDQREWDNNISQIACALRNSVHSSTKHSPYAVVFGNYKVDHASSYSLL